MIETLEKVFGPEYLKINTVFKRDERNVIIPGDWSLDEFALLADVPWTWTEKVDGTNIRLHWNGERVTIGGRTDNAQVPTFLIAALNDLTGDVEKWRSIFPEANDVTVYGEGYGAKIQKGGQYRQDQAVIVFDVRVGDWWLKPDDAKDVATKLGLEVVPTFDTMTLRDAVALIQSGNLHSHWPGAKIEGLVGRPAVDLYTRKGDRIVAKVKVKDFIDYDRRRARELYESEIRAMANVAAPYWPTLPEKWMIDFVERFERETAKVPSWMLKSTSAEKESDSKKSQPKNAEIERMRQPQATEATLDDHAENLRNIAGFLRIQGDEHFAGECADAAEEIERLQTEVAALTASHEIMWQASEKYNAEIEQYQKAARRLHHNVQCLKRVPVEDIVPALEAVLAVMRGPKCICEVLRMTSKSVLSEMSDEDLVAKHQIEVDAFEAHYPCDEQCNYIPTASIPRLGEEIKSE